MAVPLTGNRSRGGSTGTCAAENRRASSAPYGSELNTASTGGTATPSPDRSASPARNAATCADRTASESSSTSASSTTGTISTCGCGWASRSQAVRSASGTLSTLDAATVTVTRTQDRAAVSIRWLW